MAKNRVGGDTINGQGMRLEGWGSGSFRSFVLSVGVATGKFCSTKHFRVQKSLAGMTNVNQFH